MKQKIDPMASGCSGMSVISWVRVAFTLSVLALLFLVLYPIQRLAFWSGLKIADRLPVFFHRAAVALIGINIKVEGTPAQGRPLLLVSNHVSWLDISLLGSRFPLSFIAKSEVDGWPIIGLFARLQRTIYIERQRRQATGKTTHEIGSRLQQGDCLVLFAEGTSSDGGRVLPFRSALLGGVRAALLTDQKSTSILVQPVAIAYHGYRGLPMDRRQRAAYAWFGDMELAPHLLGVLADGAIDVTLCFGAPVLLNLQDDRKQASRLLEMAARALLYNALQGRITSKVDGEYILNANKSR